MNDAVVARRTLRAASTVAGLGVSGLVLVAWRNSRAFVTLDPVPRYVIGAIAIGALAWAAWRAGRPMSRRNAMFGWLLLTPLMAATTFGYVREARRELGWRRVMRPERVDAIRRLRLLIASQEDSRLARGAYSADASALGVAKTGDEQWSIRADGDRGWWAEVSSKRPSYLCRVFVRGGAGGTTNATVPEGIPSCDGASRVTAANDVRRELPAARYTEGAARPVRVVGESWLQYRRDESKSGRCCAEDGRFSWTVFIGSEIRATPAVAGDVIVVGAHGTGEIVAVDKRDGRLVWRSRAPNWIHNDPVIAGGIVYFGFGNSEAAPILGVIGSPPSGVAAYDLASGRRLWTSFTDGAVMTSPVIAGSVLAFVSSDRRAHGVDAGTGELRWRTDLPLQTAMVNPELADSTLYVASDPRQVCALNALTGQRRWCRQIPAFFGQGTYSSTSSADTTLVVTAVDDSAAAPAGLRLRWGARSAAARLWRRWITGGATGGRFAMGLSRRDGAVVWAAGLGDGGRSFGGDLGGGAASTADDVAYVVSPAGGTVTAIDLRLRRPRWQRPLAGLTRGAPAIIGDNVTIIYEDGTARVLSAATGVQLCSGNLGVRSDRAGATIAGQTAYITGLNGQITAIPVDDFVACRFGRGSATSVTTSPTQSHGR